MNTETGVGSCSPEVTELVARLRQGDVRALARAVSLVEDDAPSARQILSCCFPYTGSAMRIGITGSPGAGKSTLVDGLARRYRAQQQTVGVVAVDPTSPYTGGAILGDRIRMREHEAIPASTCEAWPPAARWAASPVLPQMLPWSSKPVASSAC